MNSLSKKEMAKHLTPETIRFLIENKKCHDCGIPLTLDNVSKSRLRKPEYQCRDCKNTDTKQDKLKIKLATIQEYGGRCVCCGESNHIFLTIDHINGNGAAERKKIFKDRTGGTRFYHWLKKHGYPKDNYQILCFNCNFAKHVLGKCPHQDNK